MWDLNPKMLPQYSISVSQAHFVKLLETNGNFTFENQTNFTGNTSD